MQPATIPYRRHLIDTLRLALPVSLGQVGIMVAGIADNVMVGRLGYEYLAASSLGISVQIIFLLFGTGFSIGLTPIVGQALGARQPDTIASAFRVGLVIHFLVGLLLFGAMWGLSAFLPYLGQDPKVVELARPFIFYLALTNVPHMVFMHFKQFTEGLQKPVPAMVFGLLGNGLNIGLNFLLIYGLWGFPRMELAGAGLATLLYRVAIVLMFVLYFALRPTYRGLLRGYGRGFWSGHMAREVLRTGLPIGAQFSMEAGGFAVGALLIGSIDSLSLAAHQIAINVASATYLAASGISTAATMRVSKLAGEGRYTEVRRAGFGALGLVIVFMASMAALMVALHKTIPSFFVDDPAVHLLAGRLLLVAAVFQLFDGVQVVGLGTQRGLKDVRYPTVVALAAYWLLGLPVSYVAGLVWQWGAQGVWLGFVVGLGVAAVALAVRFVQQSAKLVASAARHFPL